MANKFGANLIYPLIHAPNCGELQYDCSSNTVRMASIFDRFFNRSANQSCRQYPDAISLVEGLRKEEDAAIHCLSVKIAGPLYRIGKGRGLPDEDIEELHCDCILLFIEKIRTGKYEYRGNEPSTYVIEIAKRRVNHYARLNRQHRMEELLPVMDPPDELGHGSREQVELLVGLLDQLDENCRNLIRLKYLEGLRDKQVIAEKQTQYTTENALKTHRYNCMKKLAEIGERLKKMGKMV